MINQLEQETGLERRGEAFGQESLETAEDRESIILAFKLEEADDPVDPKDAIDALKQFLEEVRAFLSRLR